LWSSCLMDTTVRYALIFHCFDHSSTYHLALHGHQAPARNSCSQSNVCILSHVASWSDVLRHDSRWRRSICQFNTLKTSLSGETSLAPHIPQKGMRKYRHYCDLMLQGPEHSSCRVERFLQMADEDPYNAPPVDESKWFSGGHLGSSTQRINWQVVNCTTPANYFHVLRRQVGCLCTFSVRMTVIQCCGIVCSKVPVLVEASADSWLCVTAISYILLHPCH